MKCTSCGSNLNMEDAKCSYCGTPNPYFQKHREDMSRFQTDYEKTRKQVIEKSGRFAGFTVKITVIAVLIALDILVFFMAANVWSIMSAYEQMQAAQNADIHRQRLEAYEKDRNYLELANYYEEYGLYGIDELSDFEVVYRACSNYSYIYQYVVDFGNEDAYLTDSERIEYISDSLGYLYDSMEKNEYDDPACYEGEHKNLLEQMEYDLKVLFMTYANIPEEDAENFPQMSDGRRQVAMERGLGLYED